MEMEELVARFDVVMLVTPNMSVNYSKIEILCTRQDTGIQIAVFRRLLGVMSLS